VIIRADGDSLLLITQPDHARLAADILACWREGGFADHPRRDVILEAAREHDNGWIEEDALTHVDASGEPLDFIAVPSAVKHRIWPRAAARVGGVNPYAGALVAEHALTVHGQQRTDPAWQPFFHRMDALRAELLGRCGDAAAAVRDDYPFVQTGDQLSLIFCNAWRMPFPRSGGTAILRGTTLEVSPDPFGGARVPLSVRARRVPARRYASGADLKAAFDAAPEIVLDGAALGM
jgi:hypothetical protein